MARARRFDREGLYFHVMNRGMARRTVFERRGDIRFFLSRVAKAVRRMEIEVLAYAVLTTHYHLLVRSRGGLSEALQRVQSEFVRRFNRPRGRDGSLFRGRFHTKRVRTDAHLRNAYLYITDNPVDAGLAATPQDYPWCSAAALARRRPPLWLALDLLDRRGLRELGLASGRTGAAARRARAALIERRMSLRGGEQEDVLDDLLASPRSIRAWMRRNALVADGSTPGQPVAGIRTVKGYVVDEVAPDVMVELRRGRPRPMQHLLLAGLLRDLAAASFVEVGRVLGRSGSSAKHLIEIHRECLRERIPYLETATRITRRCIEALAG